MDHSDYFAGYDTDKPVVLLEDWSVVYKHFGTPYSAPETREAILYGKVDNHPFQDDGEYVYTTAPIASVGLEVETRNTIYVLGRANENYVEWCAKNDIKCDPMNPFGESN